MIRHIAGVAEIVEDVAEAVKFYRDVLNLEVNHEEGSGYATVEVPGVLHFGLWSRKSAAEATFEDASAISRIPLGFSIGFEVDNVEDAAKSMTDKGLQMAQQPKKEPWGQVTSRFFLPSGALSEISETPWARNISQPMNAEDSED